jgi:hypothetical protein
MSRQVVQQSVETFGFQILKLTSSLQMMLHLLRAYAVDVLIAGSALSGVLKMRFTVFGAV